MFFAVRTQSAPPRPFGGPAASTRLRIVIGDKSVPVTLNDNASAREFAALLPLSLTLEDYAATEKIATLPRKLSIEGAPAGTTPEVRDFNGTDLLFWLEGVA